VTTLTEFIAQLAAHTAHARGWSLEDATYGSKRTSPRRVKNIDGTAPRWPTQMTASWPGWHSGISY